MNVKVSSPTRRTMCLVTAALGLAGWRPDAMTADIPVWLPAPTLPDVPLLDQNGCSVHLERDLIAGRTVIVSFMFTGCQTVCPPQTALLHEASRRLRARDATRDVRVISITVDPLADGPTQLRAFGQRHQLPMGPSREWTLLTGRPADIARLLKAFDVPAGAPGDHPGLLWVGDARRGRWTRSSSLNPPDVMMALVEALQR